MAMGDNCLYGAIRFLHHPLFERIKSHAGINDQVIIPTFDMPDVAAHEVRNTGFLDYGDIV